MPDLAQYVTEDGEAVRMEPNNKIIELGKKLKALADRGIGGEKLNAERMLADMLKKHNLTIEDIEGEATADYFFTLTKEEAILWSQIVGRVNREIKKYGPIPAKEVKRFELGGNYMLTCTASEYIEIESMNHVFQKLLKEEQEFFYAAFCKANDLLLPNPNPKKIDDLTEQEIQDYLRTSGMASHIKKRTIQKQITQ